MRRVPTVVSIDASNSQNAYLLPHRRPTRFTPLTVAAGRPWERRVFDAARAIVAHSTWAADAVIAADGHPAAKQHGLADAAFVDLAAVTRPSVVGQRHGSTPTIFPRAARRRRSGESGIVVVATRGRQKNRIDAGR